MEQTHNLIDNFPFTNNTNTFMLKIPISRVGYSTVSRNSHIIADTSQIHVYI